MQHVSHQLHTTRLSSMTDQQYEDAAITQPIPRPHQAVAEPLHWPAAPHRPRAHSIRS